MNTKYRFALASLVLSFPTAGIQAQEATRLGGAPSDTRTPVPQAKLPSNVVKGTGTAGKIPKWTGSGTLGNSVLTESGGKIGIGTASPSARLEVAGTVLVTDTLTLAPAGDQALDVSTGSIYKGGALFIHTKGGVGNTALGIEGLANVTTGFDNTASGREALYSNTSGFRNTASGSRALFSNTTGFFNTASGRQALYFNTTGFHNTASGYRALYSNTSGVFNTASGSEALYSNTTGLDNTASGNRALRSNTTGNSNTACGSEALYSSTAGSYNTASGRQTLRSNTTGFDNTASGHQALRSNTTGFRNTASGSQALTSNTSGVRNTASGFRALQINTTGCCNTANGHQALVNNTTGNSNTASGHSALLFNTTGYYNTASGVSALYLNTTGRFNTASGNRALRFNTSGDRNIAIGHRAGYSLTTGSDNIDIGNSGVAGESYTTRIGASQTKTFIAGIRGVTTVNADAIAVLIDSAGQLGTVSSSRRFKEDIRDMGAATDKLLDLRPVVFRYKPEVQSGERPIEYGLIAEEVAEVFPELVVLDEEGKPLTVKYHLLSTMLLNELQKEHERNDVQAEEIAKLRARDANVTKRLLALEERE